MDDSKVVIYVYSGKGGVGKSTVSVNLAYSYALKGLKVGLIDADLSGPSIPSLVKGLENTPYNMDGLTVSPGIFEDVKINSVGFFSEEIDETYLEGPYLHGALHQLVFSVEWNCQVLIVDLPPGTMEIHNELFSKLPGKVLLVSTPQEVSFSDTIRSINFIRKMDVEILGIVENMSYYNCDNCGVSEKVFEGDTRKRICEPYNIELLAEFPISRKLNFFSNKGVPYVLQNNNCQITSKYEKLADDCFNNFNSTKKRERMC